MVQQTWRGRVGEIPIEMHTGKDSGATDPPAELAEIADGADPAAAGRKPAGRQAPDRFDGTAAVAQDESGAGTEAAADAGDETLTAGSQPS